MLFYETLDSEIFRIAEMIFSVTQGSILAFIAINPLECKGNYSATSNNMKLVHWPLLGGLLRLVQRGGDWAGQQPSSLY